MKLLLLTHAAATLIMCGVILVVQVVHYPLFGKVGTAGFVAYQTDHMRRITFVIAGPMLVELGTAIALTWWRPALIPEWQIWAGLALLAGIWISTGLLQMPLHITLLDGFDATVHQRLVATNWIRTLAWSARGVLALMMLVPLLREP